MGCVFSKGNNDLNSQSNTSFNSGPEFELQEKQILLLKDLSLNYLLQWPTDDEEASFEVLHRILSSSVDNDTRLAAPASLFAHLSPLASELPSHYLPSVKTLKKLNISSAMNTLHKSCGRLNPNQLHAVIELLQFLCDELQTSDGPSWDSESLVVPDDGCRLVPPNACVYIDRHGSHYVKFIDSSKLRFVHHDVSERLCLAFGIRKLSDVVVEELDYVEHLKTHEKGSLAAIRLKLLSRPFQVAVSTVVNNFSRITSGFKNPDFPTLERSLVFVAKKMKLVKRIYTRFLLLPKLLDITHASNESGSSHRALYYVNRSSTCMLIAEGGQNYASVFDLVAIVVSHVLGSPVPLPIGSLFLCPQDSEAAVVNHVLKLSSHEGLIYAGTGFLGRPLLPRDEKKVRFVHTLAPFAEGEIVAWQSEKGEQLKYGRVPEDALSQGQTSYSFNLETSPGITETIINSHVFHFSTFWREQDSCKPRK